MAAGSFYITTPIYYVNDKPHIGHAYTTILADVLAQYHRLLGRPVHFLTGTDEHGLKVKQAAEKAGVSPQQQADRTVVRFQEAWKKLEVTHDDFIRTTEPRHTKVVQDILQDLFDRDEIYRADYDGWYDVTSETFITEKELQDRGGPEAQPNVTRITETNYFFRMGKYQEWLIDYIEQNPGFIQPEFRRNETLGFLRKPLQDLCISRPKSRMDWGIELPFDPDFVTYVWFDALVNYISAIGYRRDEAQFGRWWPASYHLIGKDILTTHTVYWPTMLKAMGLPMPQCVFAHGWWLSGASKMSKSLGNVVNPLDMADKYGVDAFRYFLIAEMTLGQDASFTEESFIKRYNADLANDLGNLLSRLLNMVHRFGDGAIPAGRTDCPEGDAAELWAGVQRAVGKLEESIVAMWLDAGLGEVLAAIRSINRFIEQQKPWSQAKAEDKAPLQRTLYAAAEALRVCSGLLYPVMPAKMAELREALGLRREKPDQSLLKTWGILEPGSPTQQIPPLFPRVEMPSAEPAPAPAAGPAKAVEPAEAPAAAAADNLITYDDFAKVELKVGKVLEAERIEGATKLLKLGVMIGQERRQIVAGIALYYDPETLIGKSVVVVTNLKPVKLRGVESQGMLLAASRGESLRLVTVDGEISSGASVK